MKIISSISGINYIEIEIQYKFLFKTYTTRYRKYTKLNESPSYFKVRKNDYLIPLGFLEGVDIIQMFKTI